MILPVIFSVVITIIHGAKGTNYYVGTGMADVTGPAAEVNMMGYANPAQTTHGIHMRQYARAFVFANSLNGPRFAFVNIDAGWSGGAVKREVVKKLQARLGKPIYTVQNLCISGTHTHSGVAGYSQYLLFEITSLGFNKQAFNAQVDGIVDSIYEAHNAMQPADIYLGIGELLESNINRSPTAYLHNPKVERDRYKYDVDKNMTVLKIVDKDGKGFAMLSWFAVHGTSMNNTNKKISSDNKGYAAQLFERAFNPDALPGQGDFVAAFAQSNLGDVSPNTRGAHCLDTGLPCDAIHSTCNGRTELCVASGPGKDMFESTKIIGTNQFKKAMELYDSASIKLSGPIDFKHSYVDMAKQTVIFPNGTKAFTCLPSMGYSFAAGTTDGPGAFDFTQGTTSTNPFWNFVRNLIHKPSQELVDCQHPKPILLPTGEIREPYQWQAEIVDTQLLRIGQFVIIAVPGEFTTMSGRRLRDIVRSTAVKQGMPSDTEVVIAGLANEYADYITTYEEYQAQRYEGASTIFGPHTLSAYLQVYTNLSINMAKGTPSPVGPTPPDLLSKQLSFLPGVIFDGHPSNHEFGSVLQDALPSYKAGSTVTVIFQSANPRNNLRTNESFLLVEKQTNQGNTKLECGQLNKDQKYYIQCFNASDGTSWDTVCNDNCWETRFDWIRTEILEGYSEARISWEIPMDQTPGNYRIRHFGTAKSITETFSEFAGISSTFSVTA